MVKNHTSGRITSQGAGQGQYDGIAGIDDLLAFFKQLPGADKAFTVMPAVSHGSFRQKNFLASYQILHAFFTRPGLAFRE